MIARNKKMATSWRSLLFGWYASGIQGHKYFQHYDPNFSAAASTHAIFQCEKFPRTGNAAGNNAQRFQERTRHQQACVEEVFGIPHGMTFRVFAWMLQPKKE